MPFSKSIKEEALLNSRRCCCICHKFVGVYTNVHHIIQEASGGPNTLKNAVVLCLRCHGEVGHYNPKHPIGNKYSKEELRKHRDRWWIYCEEHPTKALPSRPISISPNSFRLVAGEWKTKFVLKISNQSDEVLYSVAVKLFIRVDDIAVKDIKIEPQKKESDLSHDIGDGYEFSSDILRLNGNDPLGNEISVIYIHSIDPREVLSFLVTNESSKAPAPQHKHHAVFTLLGYSEEPSEMLTQENQASILFHNYENWTVRSIGVLFAKKR